MRAIRFRCPRCRVHHTASLARAGQPFACSSCFAAMTIPEAADAPPAEAPTARSIEIPPPTSGAQPPSAILDRESTPINGLPPTPRPRRKPAAARPFSSPRSGSPVPPEPESEPIDFPYVPEPGPAAIGPPPIEGNAPIDRSTVPLGRIVAALATVAALVAVVVVAVAILGNREGKEPGVIAHPAELAVVEAAPGPRETIPPPSTPAPIADATAVPPQPVQPDDPAMKGASTPKVEEPAPGLEPEPPLPDRPLVIRRRQMLGQEALRQQLAKLPEITLSHNTEAMLVAGHGLHPVPHRTHRGHPTRGLAGQPGFLGPALAGPAARAGQVEGPAMHVAHRRDDSLAALALVKQRQPELGQLPWRMGDDCQLSHESAEELEVQSRSLRDQLSAAIPLGDTRPDADSLRAALLGPAPPPGPDLASGPGGARFARARGIGRPLVVPQLRSDVPAAIPALMQLLMAERTPSRLVLVDVLARIKGPAASKALARLAIFDLAPEVREQSLAALRDRPAEDYRSSLLEGLRYPWAPVADHAAEALVALGDREAIPTLVALLDEPDPEHPRTEVRNGQPVTYTRSLVQVNHLRNCLLCHAPSANPTLDLVRGRVPARGMPLPPPREYYAESSPGLFVRAEVTYLRQDFSATQPVEQPGRWPAFQRYDYVVSERPVPDHRPLEPKRHEKEKGKATFPQRESALFALRELTGQDLGDQSAAWKAVTRPKPPGD